jgi:hypothetical protein
LTVFDAFFHASDFSEIPKISLAMMSLTAYILSMNYYRLTFKSTSGTRTVLVREIKTGFYKRVAKDGSDWYRETHDAVQEEVIVTAPSDVLRLVPLRMNLKYGELEIVK